MIIDEEDITTSQVDGPHIDSQIALFTVLEIDTENRSNIVVCLGN